MDDPQNIPDSNSREESVDPRAGHEPVPPVELSAAISAQYGLTEDGQAAVAVHEKDAALRRLSFRHNLFLLLSLTLGAFILTSWILVRVDSPFGVFTTGPQEVVRAQLRALDRG